MCRHRSRHTLQYNYKEKSIKVMLRNKPVTVITSKIQISALGLSQCHSAMHNYSALLTFSITVLTTFFTSKKQTKNRPTLANTLTRFEARDPVQNHPTRNTAARDASSRTFYSGAG